MTKKIGIVNYNTGNVGSLYKTLKKINKNVKIIEKPNDVDLCRKFFAKCWIVSNCNAKS